MDGGVRREGGRLLSVRFIDKFNVSRVDLQTGAPTFPTLFHAPWLPGEVHLPVDLIPRRAEAIFYMCEPAVVVSPDQLARQEPGSLIPET